jgi:hypothetical protein
MSESDRKGYTDAVLCLQSLSPNTPAALVPGARSRYDDFVATHMNQTLSIHETVCSLTTHDDHDTPAYKTFTGELPFVAPLDGLQL